MKSGIGSTVLVLIFVFFLVGAALASSEDDSENTNHNSSFDTSESESQIFNVENEDEFKSLCQEFDIKDLDKKSVGMLVTKDLILGSSYTSEDGYTSYTCGAIEDFLEELEMYQHTYRVYRIKDFQAENDFPYRKSDIVRVYGIIESVSKSYQTGFYNPTIKVYYMEYIRRYGENPETAKSADEIKKEREEEAKELEYKDSLNSDYNEGTTKNLDNMNELSLKKYMSHCDAINYRDMVTASDSLAGRHVKLHIQVSEHKVFKNQEGKVKRVGEWTDISSVQEDVWYCKLYQERVEEYNYPYSNICTLYFWNMEKINAASLKKSEKLIVYGQLIKHNPENGEFEMIVRYWEEE